MPHFIIAAEHGADGQHPGGAQRVRADTGGHARKYGNGRHHCEGIFQIRAHLL
jgi:hypothetical protein